MNILAVLKTKRPTIEIKQHPITGEKTVYDIEEDEPTGKNLKQLLLEHGNLRIYNTKEGIETAYKQGYRPDLIVLAFHTGIDERQINSYNELTESFRCPIWVVESGNFTALKQLLINLKTSRHDSEQKKRKVMP